MSLIPTIYSSTDVGAPVISGTVGSMLSLLRAILVTGYGTKPGLGWTEEFTASGKAVFRNNPVTGTGYFVRVVDDGTAASGGSARSASVRAFEVMTDVDAGVNQLPPVEILSSGCFLLPKSNLLTSTARAWWAIGNERCLYLFVDLAGHGLEKAAPFFIGDLVSFAGAADRHCFALGTDSANGVFTGGSAPFSYMFGGGTQISSSTNISDGLMLARGSSGAVGAVYGGHVYGEGQVFSSALGRTISSSGGILAPMVVGGGMLYAQVPLIIDAARVPRGRFPGLYVPYHTRPLADLQVLAGPEGMPDATFVAKGFSNGSWVSANETDEGQVWFETTGPWH